MPFNATNIGASQSRCGGAGACMTICLHVARYLANLPPQIAVDVRVLDKLIGAGAAFWRTTIGKYQSCADALASNAHLRLQVEPNGEYSNSVASSGERVAEVDFGPDLAALFAKHVDVSLLLVGENQYSYLLHYRCKTESVLFFDSHGEAHATVWFLDDGRPAGERATEFLRTQAGFDEKSFSFEMFRLGAPPLPPPDK